MSGRILQTPGGERVELEQLIGQGAEAEVWSVRDRPALAAKLFYAQVLEDRDGWYPAKVGAMVAAPPAEPDPEHATIAWPQSVLYENEQFAGYLMPLLRNTAQVSYAPGVLPGRRRDLPFLTTRDYYWIATGLAAAVERVHQAGHLVGDFRPENMRWREDFGLGFVDTDSFQITAASGRVFRNEMPPPEFVAPELQGEDPRHITWLPQHDHFALAVHLFVLLFEVHPFVGVLPDGSVPPDLHLQHLAHGYFPHAQTGGAPPPPHLRGRFRCLSPQLQSAFERAFVAGRANPAVRPGAAEWQQLLGTETDTLVTCPRCGEFYANVFRQCPYCRARSAENTRTGLKWVIGAGVAMIFMLFVVAAGAWTLVKFRALASRPLPRTTKSSPSTRPPQDRFPAGKTFATTLEIDPGSPRRFILSRNDQSIELTRESGPVQTRYKLRWGSGSAAMSATSDPRNPSTMLLSPVETSPPKDGWREVRVKLGPENQWEATYRVPWSDLGYRVAEAPDEPGSLVAEVTDETPANEAGLERGDHVLPGERVSESELRLRVFRGEPAMISAFVATGEIKTAPGPGQYVVFEIVRPQSRAEVAGLRSGDLVIRIGGVSTKDLSPEGVKMLLNRITTFEIYRGSQVLELTISRDKPVRVSFPSFREK